MTAPAEMRAAIDGHELSILVRQLQGTAKAIEGRVDVLEGVSMGQVGRSAVQALTSGAETAVSFTVERRDTHNYFRANPDSKLYAPSAGVYAVDFTCAFVASNNGYRTVKLRVDGSTVIAFDSRNAAGTGETAVTVSQVVELAADQYVEALVMHTNPAGLDLVAGNYSPIFTLRRLGAVA